MNSRMGERGNQIMRIKVLEKNTAEQIAAGEVIENPASVVKELVENALDAGATIIEVELENGGKSLISVTDNGHGISAPDLPLAFQRFATSKLTLLEDLDHLSSLGFRGEALPSIAAIAQVQVTSRTKDAISGSLIALKGGDVVEQGEAGAPYGTRVEVRSLFYNTPGRLKFLRADAVESARISALLSELSLAHPGTAFTLKSGRRTLFSSTGDGKLLHAIGSLYGTETAEAMVKLKGSDKESGCSLSGYTSAPHLTRSSRRWITLAVNGRLIKNPVIVNALERAYSDLLPRQRHPLAALFLSVPPEKIDVNVHPAKIEIRFQEPETIKSLVYRTARLALQREHKLPDWPDRRPLSVNEGVSSPAAAGRDWQETRLFDQTAPYESSTVRKRDLGKIVFQPQAETAAAEGSDHQTGRLRLIGQYLQSYLVVQKDDRLLLIDQHAAHERINYHQLQLTENSVKQEERVQLTMPMTLNLPATWRSEMPRLLPLLGETGFGLEPLGEDSYVIRSVPFMMRRDIESSQLYDLLESLVTADYDSESDYRDTILKTIACHRSVKAKQALTREEMEQLLELWENTPSSEYCPHGRPTVISFDRAQLEKGFHRRGATSES